MIDSLRRLLRSRPAPPPVKAAGDGAPARVLEEIRQSQERVAECVEDIRTRTEREILACGSVLSSIVDHVRGIIGDADRALAASSARADESTTRFIQDMRADIQAQEAAAQEVLTLADAMQDAIEAINGLSQYSNLLAINARIEAARIGDAGAGFAVIAEQTRSLSQTIGTSADRVSKAIGAIRTGIPSVRERASAMQGRAQAFIDAVAVEVKAVSSRTASGSAGSQRLEEVMRLSNEALSHLQFQDPMAQALSAIGHDLEVLAGRVHRVLAGEVHLETVETAPQRRSGHPAPGKITFFQEEAR